MQGQSGFELIDLYSPLQGMVLPAVLWLGTARMRLSELPPNAGSIGKD